MGKVNPTDRSDAKAYSPWLTHADPAVVANALNCLIHQANYLLDRQIAGLEKQFVLEGGYSERLATARLQERHTQFDQTGSPDRTDRSVQSCPACGQLMILRTAREGPNTGSQFWGCSGYPGCKTTLPAQPRGSPAGAEEPAHRAADPGRALPAPAAAFPRRRGRGDRALRQGNASEPRGRRRSHPSGGRGDQGDQAPRRLRGLPEEVRPLAKLSRTLTFGYRRIFYIRIRIPFPAPKKFKGLGDCLTLFLCSKANCSKIRIGHQLFTRTSCHWISPSVSAITFICLNRL